MAQARLESNSYVYSFSEDNSCIFFIWSQKSCLQQPKFCWAYRITQTAWVV